MGVSLERVQYKFASIIGELCSEPVVLSQFAIWLDLRLAEYKSKGAISLDCSGEKPDPSWLKGLKSVTIPMVKRVLGSRLAPRAQGFSRGGMYSRSSVFHKRNMNSHSRVTNANESQQPAQTKEETNERIDTGEDNIDDAAPIEQTGGSADVVVIKDEPTDLSQDEVYPISLHAHHETESRKRTADSSAGDEPVSSTPFHKVRKLPSSTSPSVSKSESPLNQSLISVIGSTFDEQSQELSSAMEGTGSDLNFTVNLQSQTEQDSSNIQWGDNSNFYMSSADSPSTSTFTHRRTSASATVTSDSGLSQGNMVTAESAGQDGNVPWRSPSVTTDRVQPTDATCSQQEDIFSVFLSGTSSLHSTASTVQQRSGHLKSNVQRMSTITTKKRSTVGNLIYAVRTFERWLSAKDHNDQRQIEEIPPEQLDVYLTEFFGCVKNSGGRDYNSESFRILRANMDSYLKEKGYPYSISKSPAFGGSQLIFNQRKQHLRFLETQTVSPQSFLIHSDAI